MSTGTASWPPKPEWSREIHWRTLVAAALSAGIIHICFTFAAPVLGSGNAFQKLREALPLNRMVVLPPASPARQALPYLPPDALYAMCRYELAGGSVSVTAAVVDTGWVLSLHTPRGESFYVMPQHLLRRSEVSFLVVGLQLFCPTMSCLRATPANRSALI